MPSPPRLNSNARGGLDDTPIDDFLRRVAVLRKAVAGGEFLAKGLCLAVFLALVALLSDAFFAWPSAVRLAMDWFAVAMLSVAAAMLVWRLLGVREDARTLARLTEQRLGRRDSLLINAVDFRTGAHAGSRALTSSVVREADRVVAELSAVEVNPPRPALRALAAAGGVLAACGLFMLLAPGLFGAVIPRFVDPAGDHPPFTLLSFAPHVEPEVRYRGRPVSIAVEVTGPERVDEATLVLRPAGSKEPGQERLPMLRQSETLFTAQLARVDNDLEFHVETPRGRSRWFSVIVSQTPLIEEARATLTFPAYTGHKPAQQVLDDRGIRGMEGTDCAVRVRSNVPLSGGELRIFAAGDDSMPLETIALKTSVTEKTEVLGEFQMTKNGRFELAVRSGRGLSSEVLAGPVVTVPDRPPQVRITSPEKTVIAVEGWKTPVEVEAIDDVGLSRIRLFRRKNDDVATGETLTMETSSRGAATARTQIDLAALKARPGDVIRYYASADEIGREPTRSADSATQTIEVISEEDYRELAREQFELEELLREFQTDREELERLGQMRDDAVSHLEELLQEHADGQPLTGQDRAGMESLQKQLTEYASKASQLAKALKDQADEMPLFDFEKPLREQLEQLADELEAQSTQAENLSKLLGEEQSSGDDQLGSELQKAGDEFLKDHGPFDESSRESLEQLSNELETLQKMDALNDQVERLQAVTEEQRSLADRMSELSRPERLNQDQQARADRFAREQEGLADDLNSIEKGLETAAEEASESSPQMADSARQLSELIKPLAISREQLSSAQSARDGEGEAAAQHAEAAARKLESLMQAMNQVAESASRDGRTEQSQGSRQQLQHALNQLKQARSSGRERRNRNGQAQPGERSQENSSSQANGNRRGFGSLPRRGGPETPILGPPTREPVESSSTQATLEAEVDGRFVGSGAVDAAPVVESLSTGETVTKGQSMPGLRGVPVGYRDAAEAYLRRLSEERRSKE
jgi:hypothetical protein